ncbi:MAG: 6-phosphogluconolactonase [Cyanobacteria bacterium]|nr:6-phosphogluconolactonase [Cyanobacteria bacterium CG_2015-16_32_12]NCO77948.1 6-phosphogluconolactonase [Cyanobacteria bacterium CG_2015-22_32_23]NCQ03891.1 6-phosphogluconolactonase [Cyanobacteria bacterium CG_2015-09_32_10]NCQ42744.1 6-phosphogluconolactonase [Cyanobacteria bacterium CG_2015-04_32_10]NCS85141.1 6-phosphogluconolactonase [Cyanobacteria bacterium CG_2015-02_32_10]
MTKVYNVADKNALITEATPLIINKIKDAIAKNDICTIALAGGSTPKPIYEAIAEENLPWDKIHIFWGDERYVLPNHPDSNEKMARESWLDKVNFPVNNIHPMPTMSNNPQTDADKHNQELLDFFGITSGFPTFDLILLGMGDDGHTASLFPQTKALEVRDRLITMGNKEDSLRLTFTVPLINQANCVIFLVSGSNKQDALQQVFSETGDSNQYPSKLIQPRGELIWFISN